MRLIGPMLVALLVLVGCSGGGSSGSDGTNDIGQATAIDQPTIADSTPAPEDSGPESPQAPSKQPSIAIASLPIGGGEPDQVAGLQCMHVFLTNVAGRLPEGTSLTVTGTKLDPAGVFTVADHDCGGSEQSCANWTWSAASINDSCLVAARQNDGTGAQAGDTVALSLTATLTCPDDATCAALQPLLVGPDGGAGSLGGSQLAFTVQATSSAGADG